MVTHIYCTFVLTKEKQRSILVEDGSKFGKRNLASGNLEVF